MENFTNLSDRLRQFIEYKGISINKFSASVDASNSYFNKILKDNNSVGSDRIEKILRTYPEINAEWLLTGKGSMLKSEVKNEVVTPNNDKYVAMLEKNNALLEENKALLLAENERLKAEIQALKSVQSATVNQFDQPSQSKSLIQPLTQSTR